MNKKILAIITSLIMVVSFFSLTGCGGKSSQENFNELENKLEAVEDNNKSTTIADCYDKIANNLNTVRGGSLASNIALNLTNQEHKISATINVDGKTGLVIEEKVPASFNPIKRTSVYNADKVFNTPTVVKVPKQKCLVLKNGSLQMDIDGKNYLFNEKGELEPNPSSSVSIMGNMCIDSNKIYMKTVDKKFNTEENVVTVEESYFTEVEDLLENDMSIDIPIEQIQSVELKKEEIDMFLGLAVNDFKVSTATNKKGSMVKFEYSILSDEYKNLSIAQKAIVDDIIAKMGFLGQVILPSLEENKITLIAYFNKDNVLEILDFNLVIKVAVYPTAEENQPAPTKPDLLADISLGFNVKLGDIEVEKPNIAEYDGLKYTIHNSEYVSYDARKSDKTELVIPSTYKNKPVTTIEPFAFNEGLVEKVAIPNSITIIRASAFAECSKIKSITIPSSVTQIENDAFYNCTGLTKITIPSSVTKMGSTVFYGCPDLTVNCAMKESEKPEGWIADWANVDRAEIPAQVNVVWAE